MDDEEMGDLLRLLRPRYTPIAIYYTKGFPSYASRPSEESCVVASMMLHAFREGRTVAISRDLVGCKGALNGLGLGGDSKDARDAIASKYSAGTDDPGKNYFCCPEAACHNYLDAVPVYGSEDDVAVMQPIDEAQEMGADIETVAFLTDPLELSALVTLAGFLGKTDDTVVRCAFGFSCEQLYAMPKQEGERERPRLVLGATEFYPRRFLDQSMMTVSMPYSMYKEMDEKAGSSFLASDQWRKSAQPGDRDCCC